MTSFLIGFDVGAVLIFLVWVVYLEIRVQLLQTHLKKVGAKYEQDEALKAVSGLTPNELDALVSKDLSGTKPRS